MTVFPLTVVTVPGVPRPPPKPPAAAPPNPPALALALPEANADADAPLPPKPARPERPNAAAILFVEEDAAERCPYQIPAEALVTTTSAIAKTAVYLLVHL